MINGARSAPSTPLAHLRYASKVQEGLRRTIYSPLKSVCCSCCDRRSELPKSAVKYLLALAHQKHTCVSDTHTHGGGVFYCYNKQLRYPRSPSLRDKLSEFVGLVVSRKASIQPFNTPRIYIIFEVHSYTTTTPPPSIFCFVLFTVGC